MLCVDCVVVVVYMLLWLIILILLISMWKCCLWKVVNRIEWVFFMIIFWLVMCCS